MSRKSIEISVWGIGFLLMISPLPLKELYAGGLVGFVIFSFLGFSWSRFFKVCCMYWGIGGVSVWLNYYGLRSTLEGVVNVLGVVNGMRVMINYEVFFMVLLLFLGLYNVGFGYLEVKRLKIRERLGLR